MFVTGADPADRPRGGRRPSTTHAELEALAFDLFALQGFDETTIDDIASAAGIARRTFFRYYPSKTDIVWGDFGAGLDRLRAGLADFAPAVPLMEAVHLAVIEFNRLPADQTQQHRRRLSLILGVPTLLANSTLRFAQWRAVIADFSARRLQLTPDDLLPNVIAYSALGATLAGYEHWLRDEQSDLTALLDNALGELAIGFDHHDRPTTARGKVSNSIRRLP
jgi:mycofactocin system transcriptional regulator